MSISRRNFVIASSVATAGGALVLSACSSGGGGGTAGSGTASGSAATYSKVAVGTAADSAGPAPEVPGARKGGTIHPIGPDDFSHLDPQRIYFAWNSTVANLYVRCLTGYRIASDGSMKLVGDLATDAGTMSDGGATWTFTLKDGLKWEDGSELTVEDVRHGIERGFASFTTEGATYVQTWLTGSHDFRSVYKGPYGGKHLSSVVTDTAKKTITFHLKTARPDLNWALAMHSYGAVPVAHDSKEKYDKDPVSCGPYRIKQHSVDKSLTLVRNTHWDPRTDAIRNAYPDSVVFEFGPEALPATDRLIADSGTDQYAVMAYSGVPAERIQKVISDSALESRTVDGLLTGLYYYAINCRRIKDVRVRQALNYAWPLEQIRSIYGGPSAGDYATTILSPDIAGRVKFDVYGKLKNPRGDTAKAKALLKEAGKLGQKIVYTYPQGANDAYDKTKVVIVNALKEAGFDPVVKAVESTSYYDQVGQIDNQFDVMWYGWSPDWPAAYTLIQPLFDGTTIADNAPNVSQLNVGWVNTAIKKDSTITDTAKENAAWAALDKEIMAKEAPIIPETYQRRYYLYGSKVGGAQFDPLFSAFLIYKLYAKA
ncbi:ABC transporter substrate-binding protein [Streptomyces caniscabiei]|uniref:ABC transporter substrate-binding protein n=1 Tax=Streptomyces caniscabiei TaxID=2746961 RepID=UPI0029A640D3|nr:ABC transporter substrate-binding protein [Streptomyces caniscabiei]MDX2600835.1 ABC transporter substrate-binding protein [Streptomyces caniscabiei]MDX2740685.1 ABC transporter substrate-binding protein [Streptomyces caniscabiei]MDX2779957.1 ABC transporter substrate-binding protein [Streptomyces caniscabiei]